MDIKKAARSILTYIEFLFAGLVGTVLLIVVSEYIKFSHFNFVPLGGYSWASWSYPIYLSISYLICTKYFQMGLKTLFFVAILALLFFLFLNGEGGIFINPIPFGIGAY